MPSPSKILRRSRRLSTVFGRWIHYAHEHPNKKEVLDDFRVWLTTIFSRDDAGLFRHEVPWLSMPAVRWLRTHVKAEMNVFEWGSGSSSLFFSKYAGHIISVEHDPDWHERVAAELHRRDLDNVSLLLEPAQPRDEVGPFPPDHTPLYTHPSIEALHDKLFFDYVQTILNYPDESFDVILVDGRARMGCLYFARTKVKKGGCIILDNAELAMYRPAFDFFDEATWYISHIVGPVPNSIWPVFVQTTIFTKR